MADQDHAQFVQRRQKSHKHKPEMTLYEDGMMTVWDKREGYQNIKPTTSEGENQTSPCVKDEA